MITFVIINLYYGKLFICAKFQLNKLDARKKFFISVHSIVYLNCESLFLSQLKYLDT